MYASPLLDAFLLTNGGDPFADPWRELREQPEDSPGFQVVDVSAEDSVDEAADIPIGRYIVFNAELFIPTNDQQVSELPGAPPPGSLQRPRTRSSCCGADCR